VTPHRSTATCSLERCLADGGTPALALRDVRPDDEPFLFRVFADSRRNELARVPWTEAQRLAFLASQFATQYRYYREHYDGATYHIVLADMEPVGRLFIARWRDETRIMDIALVTEHQGIGIGSRVLSALCAEADATGAPMGIHVEKQNRARHLYARLGFEPREDRGVYWYLVRPPCAVS